MLCRDTFVTSVHGNVYVCENDPKMSITIVITYRIETCKQKHITIIRNVFALVWTMHMHVYLDKYWFSLSLFALIRQIQARFYRFSSQFYSILYKSLIESRTIIIAYAYLVFLSSYLASSNKTRITPNAYALCIICIVFTNKMRKKS